MLKDLKITVGSPVMMQNVPKLVEGAVTLSVPLCYTARIL